MSLLRTHAGAGIALLLVMALIMLAGCPEEPTSVAWTSGICAQPDVRCYR